MKIIGLIGGMSWESTQTYYKVINEAVNERLGGLHSAEILLVSVDFQVIEECQSSHDWVKSSEILSEAALRLERAGADFILICTNTMHKVVPMIQSKINLPIIHIAESTADELMKKNIKKAALLGTKYTMTEDFYKQRLIDRGIEVMIPEANDIEQINQIIFNELCKGVIKEESKQVFQQIIKRLYEQGAEGVILGCTEIGLLIKQEDVPVPTFDTALIHALKAVELALSDSTNYK